MDHARHHRCEAIPCRIGPAGAVAQIANGWNVLTGSRAATRRNRIRRGIGTSWPSVQHRLATFAGKRPGAALGDEIHGAGMEIHAKDRDGASSSSHDAGAARGGNAAVGCAVRVDPESLVFFNDPAIVGKRHQCTDAGAIPVAVVERLGVQHVDLEIAGRRKYQGDGSGVARRPR